VDDLSVCVYVCVCVSVRAHVCSVEGGVLLFLLSVFVKYMLYGNDRLEKNLIMTTIQNVH